MVERDLSGSVLDGRYRLLSLLGMGGMGQVYHGKHLLLGRRVAVKILPETLSKDARFRARFAREARAASKIAHLNVVQVLDFGESLEGPAYIVMEFLEGRDLRDLLRRSGKLPWPRARHMLLQAVSALKAAHAHDIVHRDIKPGNCFVLDLPQEGLTDVVKLLDFGIAKVLTEPESDGLALVKPLTGTGEIMGTASYMAPEQARGEPLDARSDIYSLGIMAYEMLTGRVPFVGINPLDVISRHLHAPPPPLRRVVPDVLPELEAIVLRTLAKNPRDRFESTAELETALLAIPGPSLPTVRTRVSSTSGAQWGAVGPASTNETRAKSGQFQRAAEEMATEAEHQGVTPCFGALEEAREARHAGRKERRVGGARGDRGSDDTTVNEDPPAPARAGAPANTRPSQAITKVRLRTTPLVEEAVDPAAATVVDPSRRPQPAAPKKRGRTRSPRPSASSRQPPQRSTGPLTRRGSRGVTISRLLGVVFLLGSGVTIASMTMPERKDGRPASGSTEDEVPAELQASIVTGQATDAAAFNAPIDAKSVGLKPDEPPNIPTTNLPAEGSTPILDAAEPVPALEATTATPPAAEEASRKDDECGELRRRAVRKKNGGDYPALYKLTKRKSCWGPKLQTEYLKLRALALLETSRYDECIRTGEGSRDPEVSDHVESCRHNLKRSR